jgi:hypothetical protein
MKLDLLPGTHSAPLNIEITSMNYTMTSETFWGVIASLFFLGIFAGFVSGKLAKKSIASFYFSENEALRFYSPYSELDLIPVVKEQWPFPTVPSN